MTDAARSRLHILFVILAALAAALFPMVAFPAGDHAPTARVDHRS